MAQLLAGNEPIIKDGEIWFYYTGLKWRSHPSSLKEEKGPPIEDAGAICLAKLRFDGFVSLHAGSTPGYAVTRPFVLAGSRLRANLEAPGGELRAEVLGERGRTPLEGFSLDESEPAGGDHLDTELTWKSGADLSSLRGRTIRLRFQLRDAHLCSYWMSDS